MSFQREVISGKGTSHMIRTEENVGTRVWVQNQKRKTALTSATSGSFSSDSVFLLGKHSDTWKASDCSIQSGGDPHSSHGPSSFCPFFRQMPINGTAASPAASPAGPGALRSDLTGWLSHASLEYLEWWVNWQMRIEENGKHRWREQRMQRLRGGYGLGISVG